MSNEIILYDLPSKGDNPKCWSLNPWKARLALNFKSLPYKTNWLEYPDLTPTFSSLSIPPNDPQLNPNASYSSPAIRLPDGKTYVMDSLAIAHALESLQPSPSLHLDSPLLGRAQAIVAKIWKALTPLAIPRVPEMLLNPRSKEYFEETRAKRFGKPLAEVAREVDVEQVWKDAAEGLDELSQLLREDESGPFVMGRTASFADFVIVGMWHFARKVERSGDIAGRGMEFDERFRAQYEGCGKWLARED